MNCPENTQIVWKRATLFFDSNELKHIEKIVVSLINKWKMFKFMIYCMAILNILQVLNKLRGETI